ncbi:16S rRNA (uracil(1498)-N(3))-methyltransferase [Oligoflexaceae bacterium]|nr:16S rRNA (uracil(1498)-N(3))-methyltransferase [Oligoflexaceae bacterium]
MKHIFRFLGTRSDEGWNLREEDIHHLVKVVHAKVGDRFEICDQNGWVAQATIVERQKKDLVFKILSENFEEAAKQSVTLFCAACKPGVFDEALPSAIELDVSRIFVFAQDKGELKKLNDKVLARWQRISDEAMKQSKRRYVAPIEVCADFESALKLSSPSDFSHLWMLDEMQNDQILDSRISSGSVALLVGSEYGLSHETRATAEAAGFKSVRMARNVLKAKTAIISALAITGKALM